MSLTTHTMRRLIEDLATCDRCPACVETAQKMRAILDGAAYDVLSISESGDRSTLRRSIPDPEDAAAAARDASGGRA